MLNLNEKSLIERKFDQEIEHKTQTEITSNLLEIIALNSHDWDSVDFRNLSVYLFFLS